MNQRLQQQINFVIEIDRLKGVLRQTLLMDSSRQENSAEHSWHLAIMALTLAEYAPTEVEIQRAMKMHNIHRDQVMQRIAPIKTGAPQLWPFVLQLVEDSVQAGYLKG